MTRFTFRDLTMWSSCVLSWIFKKQAILIYSEIWKQLWQYVHYSLRKKIDVTSDFK